MSPRIALVLLAAGQSRRFDGDKLRYAIDGVPMLSRMLQLYADPALCEVFCRKTVVLSADRADFAPEAAALGFHSVFNPHPEDGQSQSVRLGALDAQGAMPDGILFSVADQPYLQAETVRRLFAAFAQAPDRIVQTAAAGRRGNPVLFPAALAEELCALKGDVGGSAVIRRHADRLLLLETDAKELHDIDHRSEA